MGWILKTQNEIYRLKKENAKKNESRINSLQNALKNLQKMNKIT